MDSHKTDILTIACPIQEHWIPKTLTTNWGKAQGSGTYWQYRWVLRGASRWSHERRIEAATLSWGRVGKPFSCFGASLTRLLWCIVKNSSTLWSCSSVSRAFSQLIVKVSGNQCSWICQVVVRIPGLQECENNKTVFGRLREYRGLMKLLLLPNNHLCLTHRKGRWAWSAK